MEKASIISLTRIVRRELEMSPVSTDVLELENLTHFVSLSLIRMEEVINCCAMTSYMAKAFCGWRFFSRQGITPS